MKTLTEIIEDVQGDMRLLKTFVENNQPNATGFEAAVLEYLDGLQQNVKDLATHVKHHETKMRAAGIMSSVQ